MKTLVGLGIGPGDPELITLKAINQMKSCDCVFVPKNKNDSLARTIASPYLEGKRVVELSFPMGEDNQERYVQAAQVIDSELDDDQTGTFLTLGDPMLYSTFVYLMREVQKLKISVSIIPGITSYHAAAAVLKEPLTIRNESVYVVDGSVDENILSRVDTVCVLKPTKKMEEILTQLEKFRFQYMYIKRCSQAGEMILTHREEILQEKDYLSLIIAKRT